MKIPRKTIVVWSLVALLSVAAVVMLYRQRQEIEGLRPRAAKMDRLCHMVKSTLELKERDIRKGGMWRDLAIGNFGEDRLGDGNVMLSFCVVGGVKFDDFAACRDRNDHSCLADFMADAARRVR